MNRLTLLLSIALVIILSACDDPNETHDKTAPLITITSPSENAKVKGAITISAMAEDVDEEIAMQLFVDGVLASEAVTKSITAEVDTRNLNEGLHSVKVTAIDKAGNKSEKHTQFEVRNNLFVLHGSSNYVPANTTIHLVLSKNDGTIIAVEEILNNATVIIPTPEDFNLDSTFVFTEYFHLDQPSPFYSVVAKAVNAYAGITAGEYQLPQYPSYVDVGSSHVEVKDVLSRDYLAFFSGQNAGGIWGTWGDTNTIAVDLPLTNATSDLLFIFKEPSKIPVYKYIREIGLGGNTAFSLKGLPQTKAVSLVTNDNAGRYSVTIEGVAEIGINQPLVYLEEGDLSNGKFPVYYPAKGYPEYQFDLSYYSEGVAYRNNVIGSKPPINFEYLNAQLSDISYQSRNFSAVTTGAFDLLTFGGGSVSYLENGLVVEGYSLAFPYGVQHHVTLPQTPAELAAHDFMMPDNYNFSRIVFDDYAGISGVSGYQHAIVFPDDKIHRQERAAVEYARDLGVSAAVARIRGDKKVALPVRLQQQLKRNFIGIEFIDKKR